MTYHPIKKNTQEKYKRIQKRYEELYNGKRMRIDDVIATIKEEFFLSDTATVWRILKTVID